jgi:hypothetical protein
MSGSRTYLATLAASAVFLLSGASHVQAQGCVAARMSAPDGPTDPEGNSYYLSDNHWQASVGYQHFRSHRHFVGSVEQNAANVANGTAERDRSTTEVVNHMNIPDLSLGYGVTDRLSITADLPIILATRLIPGNVFAAFLNVQGAPDQNTKADGIGDLNVIARYWVASPSAHSKQNLSVGLGFKLPTGNDDVTDSVTTISATGATPVTAVKPVDQSIQPGDGGFGFITEIQGFKSFGKVTTFASASYLFNPRATNGILLNPTAATQNPATAYFSVADQFAARIGAGTSFNKLGASLSARLEGVPSADVFGSSEGFRRPGYSIAIEPGLSYSWKRSSVSLSVPYLVYRNRTQSYADKLATETTGKFTQGDAAFADYIIIAGYTMRF